MGFEPCPTQVWEGDARNFAGEKRSCAPSRLKNFQGGGWVAPEMPSGQNQNDPRGGAPAPPHGSRGRFVTENGNFPQGANDLALVL